jgi:hypothetical protein
VDLEAMLVPLSVLVDEWGSMLISPFRVSWDARPGSCTARSLPSPSSPSGRASAASATFTGSRTSTSEGASRTSSPTAPVKVSL